MATVDEQLDQPGSTGDLPSSRWTARVLSAGTVVSIGSLIVGFVLALLGREATADDPRRLDRVVDAALSLRPWGWSMIGVIALLLTPAAGLVASAVEMRRHHPRAALLALVVVAILVTAALFALRG